MNVAGIAGERVAEARLLDDRVLRAIAGWHLDDAAFEALARDLFAHQVRYNAPYAAFARSRGFDPGRVPASWREIPAVPSLAFKETALTAFDVADAKLAFATSGTTQAESGIHYFETTALYDAALLAGFERFMLHDGVALRYLLLVPTRATSSLGYMMRRVADVHGDAKTGWYLDDEALDVERLVRDADAAYHDGIPVCIAGTAFAFVALLDALEGRGARIRTHPGSRIMETGGFKGRTRSVERSALYRALSGAFSIPESAIVAEYGMTELTSQYYDARASRAGGERIKLCPPWMRPLVAGLDGREVAPGEIGVLRHVDLANRGSAIAVETEDLALRLGTGDGFVLLGRDPQARLRGCSLDAEDLATRAH